MFHVAPGSVRVFICVVYPDSILHITESAFVRVMVLTTLLNAFMAFSVYRIVLESIMLNGAEISAMLQLMPLYSNLRNQLLREYSFMKIGPHFSH